MRKACIASCGRESLDRLQIVGVGSPHNLWRLVEYETFTEELHWSCTGTTLVLYWHWFGAGRSKKEDQGRLAPKVSLDS